MVKMSGNNPPSAMSTENQIKALRAYLNNTTNGKTDSKNAAIRAYKQLNPNNQGNINIAKVTTALEELKKAAVAAEGALPPTPPSAAVAIRNYKKWNIAKIKLQQAINKINNKPEVRNALTPEQYNAINSVIKKYDLNINPTPNAPRPGFFSRFGIGQTRAPSA
jgi:hypothetical protein